MPPQATADRHIITRDGHPMRLITSTDPAGGQACEFLTNEMDLTAGVIAELDRRRWDVEKVFDEIKNKLGEKKAWGTSLEAKATQGQLVAPTHNLLLHYEARLEREHGANNAGLDGRTTARESYRLSQKIRKRVEEIIGWIKTVGGLRRSRYRGLERTQAWGYFVAGTYNLVRMARLSLAGAR